MAQTSALTSEAARRYATALFDLAEDSDTLAQINSSFAEFTALLVGNDDLARMIASPLFSRADKAATLKKLAEAAALPDLLTRFLGTVAMNGRAADLPAAQAAFDALYARKRNIQRALVRTAKDMDADQQARLEGIIAKAVGGDVELTTEVDADLVGGIQLRIGSTLIDASLKAKLERLNTAMKGA